MSVLEDKSIGALAGAAVGDALGGATEGWTPEQIVDRYGGPVTGIVPPYFENWRDARPIAPYHKGDGHVTDDTLMTHALVDVYAHCRSHLDAYVVAEHLVPLLMEHKRWIPELETSALLLQRIFLAEKWLVARLHYGHVDPREAGVGNIVNCGAAMYMAPVGIANAADPAGAYAEAIDIAGAHQSSFGREAAGVFAAAVAAAMTPGATPGGVFDAALDVAHDGTRAALAAIRAATNGDLSSLGPRLRAAIDPYDTVGPDYRVPDMDARRPSRTKSIEELPVALGFVLASGGDVRTAVLGAVNYGRDADSIATMAGAITGALNGLAAVPQEWREQVCAASRIDIETPGRVMAEVLTGIHAADQQRSARVRTARNALLVETGLAETGHAETGHAETATAGHAPAGLTWTAPADLLAHAMVQAADEDIAVDDLAARWQAVGGSIAAQRGGAGPDVAPELKELAGILLDEIDRRRAASAPAKLDPVPDVHRLGPADIDAMPIRVRGAWLGRAIGCVLGKPVEKLPREGVRAIAQATGNWPIRQYFTAVGLPTEVAERWPWNRRSRATSLVETLAGIPEDDDLNFTMLALALVEQHGAKLSTPDVAEAWLDRLPAGRVFTAERAAYRNLLLAVPPDRAADVRNPFREWIGAQIRADFYGWARPGDPSGAARLADADALLTHRRDGVHGARWVAGMSAAALVRSDVAAVIDAGLSIVPQASRLAAAVRFGVDLARSEPNVELALDRLHAEYGHLHWVHVLNNAALIAYALIAGDGDLGRSIGLAVAGGWDTDSDGATVGAVCGAINGAAALPQHWTAPLGDAFTTSLSGFDKVTLDELTERTMAVQA